MGTSLSLRNADKYPINIAASLEGFKEAMTRHNWEEECWEDSGSFKCMCFVVRWKQKISLQMLKKQNKNRHDPYK